MNFKALYDDVITKSIGEPRPTHCHPLAPLQLGKGAQGDLQNNPNICVFNVRNVATGKANNSHGCDGAEDIIEVSLIVCLMSIGPDIRISQVYTSAPLAVHMCAAPPLSYKMLPLAHLNE